MHDFGLRSTIERTRLVTLATATGTAVPARSELAETEGDQRKASPNPEPEP